MRDTLSFITLLALLLQTRTLRAQEAPEAADWHAQLLGRLHATAIGAELTVTLRSGDTVEGHLAEVADTFFGVWVDMDEDTRRRVGLSKGRLKKRLDYKEVQSIEGIRDVRTSAEGLAFRLRFRDTVHIHTASGETIRGWVEDFDGNLLRVDGNTVSLSQGDVRRIELEVSDPLGNGALIGAVIGAGLVGLPCAGGGCDAGLVVFGALFYAGVGAGFGVLVDSAFHDRELIYAAPFTGKTGTSLNWAPLISRDKKGVLFSFRF